MTLKTSVPFVLFVLSVFSLQAADSIPAIRWDIETTRQAPYTLNLYHGETVYLEPEYLCLNDPLTFSNVTAVALQYRSTDMDEGTYYQVTGTVQSASAGRLQIPWTPAAEGTNTTYTYNIVVTSSNGMSPRAFGTIRISGIVSGTSTSTPSILPHYAGTLIITNNGVPGQVVVCSGGSSSGTHTGLWSSVAGTGDMLSDVYDPIHGNKQVAFADELPGQSNNILALAQTRIDGSSNSVLAIVQTRLDGSSNSVLALAQQSVSAASNALHTAITGETARAQAAEAGALHTNGDNAASTVLPALGMSITTNANADQTHLVVSGCSISAANGTYEYNPGFASYTILNPPGDIYIIFTNDTPFLFDATTGSSPYSSSGTLIGQWPGPGAPTVAYGNSLTTNTAQSVATLARAALTTAGFTMGGAINMGGNNFSGVGALASFGNTASGAAAVALGAGASATHNNTFIWSDSTPTSSSAANQFTVTAAGGIRLQGNTTNTGNLAVGGTISGSGHAITSLNGTNITAGTVSTNALDAASKSRLLSGSWGYVDPQPTQAVYNIQRSSSALSALSLTNLSTITGAGTAVFDVVTFAARTNALSNYSIAVTGITASATISNRTISVPIPAGGSWGIVVTNVVGGTNLWIDLAY